jgi:hypothetical protein
VIASCDVNLCRHFETSQSMPDDSCEVKMTIEVFVMDNEDEDDGTVRVPTIGVKLTNIVFADHESLPKNMYM